MVAHGITRARLPAGNAVLCILDDPATPAWPGASATPAPPRRSSSGASAWRGALVAIGNAPTALFHLLELLDAGAPPPGGHHRPAGRLRRRRGVQGRAGAAGAVPCLTLHGRRGGSAMAVAAVNALANDTE